MELDIKVTPDVLVQGDGNLGGLLSGWLTQRLMPGSGTAAVKVGEAKDVPPAK